MDYLKGFIFFLFCLTFFFLPADTAEELGNYQLLYSAGKDLLFKQDYPGAIRRLKRAVKLNAKGVKSYTSLGMAYYKAGDKRKARKYWLEGYHLNPRNSELYGILEKTKDLSPKEQGGEEDWERYFRAGNRYYKERDYRSAVQSLEKALELNPESRLSYFTLAAAYRKLGNLEKAMENWQITLRLNPEDKMVQELVERLKLKIFDDKNRGRVDEEIQKELEKMVFIPAGEFIMGSDKEMAIRRNYEAGVDEFPQHKVFVRAFYIDKYEMTNYRYQKFIEVTKRPVPDNEHYPDDPYIWRDGKYRKGEDNYPVALVNWFDANAYCRWRGKRLPTEEEWEKAARGTDGRLWPWGNEEGRLHANTGDLQIGHPMYVGAFEKGVSPYGVYNLSGNLEEWTDSWYNPYPGSQLKRENFGQKVKVVKGGSFLKPFRMFARAAERFAIEPNYAHRTVGFRCAKSA